MTVCGPLRSEFQDCGGQQTVCDPGRLWSTKVYGRPPVPGIIHVLQQQLLSECSIVSAIPEPLRIRRFLASSRIQSPLETFQSLSCLVSDCSD